MSRIWVLLYLPPAVYLQKAPGPLRDSVFSSAEWVQSNPANLIDEICLKMSFIIHTGHVKTVVTMKGQLLGDLCSLDG